MTLSIQAFIVSYNIISEWTINSNFLEANVINIVLLIIGLVYVLRKFLGEALSSRQQKVLVAIQEAEDQLKQARYRLSESEKQLAHSQIIIKQIRQEATITAQKVYQSILDQGTIDVQRLTAAGKASIASAENQVRKQIQQQIATLAIKRVFTKLKEHLNSDIQTAIIDQGIKQLGGKL
uniref:ATP synthase CFO B chain subunit I n=1 Tax=Hildenbrandia rivularis TaxID=135206 RepID=A0A1C9CFF8_9FLOR|nr:ATP synthase CFO B chain subunit I [Hildenbrandia rivularis]AOM67105.1 ATP synthase CFO B chain subunit I [Hildenbrandia rivularis]